MNIENIIYSMSESEKEEAISILYQWRTEHNKKWAREWLNKNKEGFVGQSIMAEIRHLDKLSAIRMVQTHLDITLSRAKCLVEIVNSCIF